MNSLVDCKREFATWKVSNPSATKKQTKDANTKVGVAKRKRKESIAKWEVVTKKRKLCSGGFSVKIDQLYLKYGANHEHYRGGQFDGGSCRSLMGNTKLLFLDLVAYVEERHDASCPASFQQIRAKLKLYERAQALLDVVWSSVRGIDGLLPTEEFKTQLATLMGT